jgi:inhibitor of KinA
VGKVSNLPSVLRKLEGWTVMEVVPLGDSALLVRLENDLFKSSDESLRNVLDALRQLQAAQIPGVIDLTSAYTSVAVFFDPVRVVEAGAPIASVIDWLTEKIQRALHKDAKRKQKKVESRIVEIPVCYEDEFAPDLGDVARRASISKEEVTKIHTAPEYRVACVGFTPGFGFLSGLDPKLATPRRATPRTDVPLGSVAIGGTQTGVYPMRSPGGWNIIGRTPLRMFDVHRDPPTLLCAGDRVRFRGITREEFERLKQ